MIGMHLQLRVPYNARLLRPAPAENQSKLWVSLILVPLFFVRIFIGGEANDYNDFRGINFTSLSYICDVAIVCYYFIGQRRRADVDGAILVFGLPIVLMSLIHAILLLTFNEVGKDFALIAIGRGLLWLLCCLMICGATTQEQLLKMIIKFS